MKMQGRLSLSKILSVLSVFSVVQAFTLLPFTVSAARAAEVSGVTLADKARVTADGPELVLNGAGLRTRMVFKVYVAGLYVTDKKSTAADILALKGPKRVQLTLLRELSAEQLVEALGEGLKNNNGADELARIKTGVDALMAAMLAIKRADKGSVISFDYVPGTGTRITVNAEARGAPIAGEDLYNAVLKIWLGDSPVQDSLKKSMLGG
jgi:hypothetical protein